MKGTVNAVTLPLIATGRHYVAFRNATVQTVIFTSPETIDGFPTGYGVPMNETVVFVRDPSNNHWQVW